MKFAFGLFLSVLSAASAAALPVDPNRGVAATQARVELLLEDLLADLGAALEGLLTDEDDGFDLEAERRELEEELKRLEEWFRKDKEEIRYGKRKIKHSPSQNLKGKLTSKFIF